MIRTKNHIVMLITVAITGSLLYFYFDPSLYNFFPHCPLYYTTGLFCPGCGSQRAFHDLLHADVLHAADHNLMFVIFLPLVIFSAVAVFNNIFFRKKIAQRLFNSTLFSVSVLGVVILFFILRNIPWAPFTWLAP